jgi:hypothetical protein
MTFAAAHRVPPAFTSGRFQDAVLSRRPCRDRLLRRSAKFTAIEVIKSFTVVILSEAKDLNLSLSNRHFERSLRSQEFLFLKTEN